MGEAFIVRRGGIGKAFAAISVSYPAGSICTCTKGSRVLKAKDTAGQWMFLLPESGDWAVECHTEDGGKNKEKTVSVSKNKTYAVELFYTYDLFRAGSGAIVPLVTKTQSKATVTISNESIVATASGSANIFSSFCTESEVDVSKFKELVIKISGGLQTGTMKGMIGFSTRLFDASINTTPNWAASIQQPASTDVTTLRLPVPAAGSYYIGAYGFLNGTIYDMYLE